MERILIIGGTGIAGRAILKHLNSFRLPVIIDVASRGNYVIDEEFNKSIILDINSISDLRKYIPQYNFIIIAVGPFTKGIVTIHSICIEYQIPCIDINDDFYTANEIQKLENKAIQNNASIYTAMGLAPGLSTFLLKLALKEITPDSNYTAGLRMHFGAGVHSGKASIENTFTNIRKRVYLLKNGKITMNSMGDIESSHLFTFDESHKDLPLVFYSSPEIYTLTHSDDTKKIKNFDSAFSMEHMSPTLVHFLCSLGSLRKYIGSLMAKFIYKYQDNVQKENKSESIVLVCAFVKTVDSTVKCGITYHSSFELTAIFCALVIKHIFEKKIDKKIGIISSEQIDFNIDDFIKDLNEKNVFINIEKS